MYYKYPRTPHLPWSPGATNDDKVLVDTKHFIGKHVVVTEKLDGENTTLYHNHLHARSIDSKNHPSRDWIKAFHSTIKYKIPDNARICGENMFAKHSIYYEDLNSFFYVFSYWINNLCMNWQIVLDCCRDLGLEPVPVLYDGIYDEEYIKTLYKEGTEGYVIRLWGSFKYEDFKSSVAKFVRLNHVQTDEHWMHSELIKNRIKK